MMIWKKGMIDLKHGDAMNLLQILETKSVDLCLTDPPYNIGDKSKLTKVKNSIQTTADAWGGKFQDSWATFEEYADWILKIFSLVDKALKDNGSCIIFLDRKMTGYFIYRMEHELGWTFKSKFYFEKLNPVPHIRKNNYLSNMEEAIWMVKTSNRYTINFLSQTTMKPLWKGCIGSNGNKRSDHPTEKYEWMISPLLQRHARRGQTVLDPFMGSGIVGMISKRIGMNFIGFEKERGYFMDAKRRIDSMGITSEISTSDCEVDE